MLGDSLDAFIRADGALGRKVCKDDDVVDSLHDSVFRVLLTHMMADAKTITPSLELLLVGRNLERIADLATNIGEDAGMVMIHAQTIRRARPQRTAEKRYVAPAPIMEPAMVCVVLTGMP